MASQTDFLPGEVAQMVLEEITADIATVEARLHSVGEQIAAAEIGSSELKALAELAIDLRNQRERLYTQQAEVEQSIKTEDQLAAERAQLLAAERAQAAARAAQAELTAAELIERINTASDALARALAEAAESLPAAEADLAGGHYRLAGHWREILPSVAGNGKIGALPYVVTGESAALLSTRRAAGGGRHLG